MGLMVVGCAEGLSACADQYLDLRAHTREKVRASSVVGTWEAIAPSLLSLFSHPLLPSIRPDLPHLLRLTGQI